MIGSIPAQVGQDVFWLKKKNENGAKPRQFSLNQDGKVRRKRQICPVPLVHLTGAESNLLLQEFTALRKILQDYHEYQEESKSEVP